MAARPVHLVNKQYNSPINLYSSNNVAAVLNKQSGILNNGAVGIDFHNLAKPANLTNSAVLRMLEEEDKMRGKGLKRVAWPPPPEDAEILIEEQAPVYSQGPGAQQQQQQQPIQPIAPAHPIKTVLRQSPVPFQPPPSTVTLRQTAPINQEPPPVFTSQPATASIKGGVRMRGDLKWPPEPYKQQAAAENEARLALAKGPVCRPRKVKKDYTSFFAQNALNSTYPGYKVPPGTQHYIEEGTSNL